MAFQEWGRLTRFHFVGMEEGTSEASLLNAHFVLKFKIVLKGNPPNSGCGSTVTFDIFISELRVFIHHAFVLVLRRWLRPVFCEADTRTTAPATITEIPVREPGLQY